MGWLKENWLDALIFFLLALVVAGIVLYLIGVNPLARTPAPAPAGPEAPPPVSSQAPLNPPPSPPSQEEEPVVTVLPMFDPSGQSNPLPQAPAEVPKAKTPVPQTPSPERPASGVWRVAVGSFANPENALKLSRELSAKGFTVRLEAAGRYTRVVVGPYMGEEEAKRAAQALSGYAPRVYRGEGPPFSVRPEGAKQPFAYFQVGAFRKEENALALAARLKGAGISVVIRKDGLYRVLVGPVSEGKEEALKARLEAMGLTPLEVR